jgi:hypothetical protein
MDLLGIAIAGAFTTAAGLGGVVIGGRQADRRARSDEARAWRDRAAPVLARIDLIIRDLHPPLFQAALEQWDDEQLNGLVAQVREHWAEARIDLSALKHGHPRDNVRAGSSLLFALTEELVGTVKNIIETVRHEDDAELYEALLKGEANACVAAETVLSRLTEELHKPLNEDAVTTIDQWLGGSDA